MFLMEFEILKQKIDQDLSLLKVLFKTKVNGQLTRVWILSVYFLTSMEI